jgi:glycosyltransferase involved in cell wall biosynthesis
LTPSFSIVIPTYFRPAQLAQCLEALSRLEYPKDRFDVIVVDDGSASGLDQVVSPFRDRLILTLLHQPNSGPAAARNTGAERARGEFLAFTDDDCLPEPDWLRQLAEVLEQLPECMVGGSTSNAVKGNFCSATSQLITDVVYRHYNAVPLHARFLASNNLALSAARFREIGGFNRTLRTAEDRDLCDRWLHGGRRIIFHPPARVWHARDLNTWSFCRQHFGYGRGAARFHRLRALRKSGSLISETGFHLNLGNWLWKPLMAVPRRQLLPVAGLLTLWQMTNLAGFIWETLLPDKDVSGHRALSLSR